MKFNKVYIPKEVYMPIIIILVTFVLEKLILMIIKRVFKINEKNTKLDKRRLLTISSILKSITKYSLWIIAILAILTVYGVNTAAIITGLGVVSLVIGLAFQDILKDVLVGITILFDNQFAVGDVVKIDDFTGTVISIGLKSTRIQAYTGEIEIISNRNISKVINYSLDKTLAIVDLPVSYESDLDKVEKALKVSVATLKEKIPQLLDDAQILGVESLDDSAVIYRITGKCKPAAHFAVQRMMRRELKQSMDKAGIKIPYMQIEVHNEK